MQQMSHFNNPNNSQQYQTIAQNKMQPIQMYQHQAMYHQQQQHQQQVNLQQYQTTQNNLNQRSQQIPQTEGTNKLNFFLQTAPSHCSSDNNQSPVTKLNLGNGESICCTYWNGKHYITGTDIVRVITYRMGQIGKAIHNMKKYEEGIFSDLRNLKVPIDARLEEPRSAFLEFLHKNGAIRTQKKQKVFFWERVPHDNLFRDCLERIMKKNVAFGHQQQMMMQPWMMYHQHQQQQQQQQYQHQYQQPHYQQQPQYQQPQQLEAIVTESSFLDLLDEDLGSKISRTQPAQFLIDEIKPINIKGIREPNNSNLMTSLLNDGGNYDPLTDMMIMNGYSGGGGSIGSNSLSFDDEFKNNAIFFSNSIAPNM